MSVLLRRPLAREAAAVGRRRRGARRSPDLARATRCRPGGSLVPAHVPAPARLRPLEQLLVRGPLLVRHLQLHLLPARRRARDHAARDRLDRRRGARVHARRLARVGERRALLEPRVRGALDGHRPLRGVPVRARDGVRAALDQRAPARPPAPLRAPALPDAAREPARVPAARAGARRRRARAAAAARDRRRDRGRGRASSSCCAGCSPGRGSSRSASPTSCRALLFGVLGMAVTVAGRRRSPPLRPLRGLPRGAARRVRRAERPRLERRAPQVRGDPARAARGDDRAEARSCSSVPLVAVAGFWNLSALAHTARTACCRPGPPPRLLAARHPLPARAPQPVLPRRGRRHRRALACRLPPDAGIPIVRGWYRQNDFPQNELLYDEALGGPRLPRLAARARCALRRDHGRAAGLQRARARRG